ncbi:hypothetical protein TgHK011_006296 [Trichoderma gracile]|nr:hypothetical protein TgHK011_006296 [Trichoderma gracile]
MERWYFAIAPEPIGRRGFSSWHDILRIVPAAWGQMLISPVHDSNLLRCGAASCGERAPLSCPVAAPYPVSACRDLVGNVGGNLWGG